MGSCIHSRLPEKLPVAELYKLGVAQDADCTMLHLDKLADPSFVGVQALHMVFSGLPKEQPAGAAVDDVAVVER